MSVLALLFYLLVAFLLFKILKSVFIFLKWRMTSSLPIVFQLMEYAPFQIPLLSGYAFINNQNTVTEALQTKSPKNKYLGIVFGSNRGIYIANPIDIRNICITKASKMYKPAALYNPFALYGENILTAPTFDTWKVHRSICASAFDERHLSHVVDCTNQVLNEMFARYDSKINNKCLEIDPSEEIVELTLHVIGMAGFGIQLNREKQQQLNSSSSSSCHKLSFKKSLEGTLTAAVLIRAAAPYLWNTPFASSTRLAVNETSMYIDEMIHERSKQKEDENSRRDLLSMLLQSFNKDRNALTMEEIKSNAWVFLFAGHDTTSSAVQFLLYELAKNEHIQDLIYNEVKQEIGLEMEPSMEDCKKLKYTLQVVHENLRLHGPVVGFFKSCTEDLELSGGDIVPANSLMIILSHAVHHDPELWPEPNEFKPERFASQPKSFTFLSFSVGNRSCIGERFSILEQLVIVSRMVTKYRIKFPQDLDPKSVIEHAPNAILKPKNLRIVLEPRK